MVSIIFLNIVDENLSFCHFGQMLNLPLGTKVKIDLELCIENPDHDSASTNKLQMLLKQNISTGILKEIDIASRTITVDFNIDDVVSDITDKIVLTFQLSNAEDDNNSPMFDLSTIQLRSKNTIPIPEVAVDIFNVRQSEEGIFYI